jgi:hypothetical protein
LRLFWRSFVFNTFNMTTPFRWKAFIHFTVCAPYDMSFICLFVLILQRSPALIVPYIFRTTFRSGALSAFVSYIAVIQAFVRSVSMSHIRILSCFSLVQRDRNFDLKSLICSMYSWFAVKILEWVSAHFYFLLLMVDPKYVNLSTHLSLNHPLSDSWDIVLLL